MIMECPVCEHELVSNITTKEYCALCGMPAREEHAVTQQYGNETKHFCCDTCQEKFTAFYKKQ